MRIRKADLERAAGTISAMKFYPTADEGVRLEVMDLLAHLCGSAEDLEWLRTTLRDKVREWPGLAEIRAVYCTSKRPADGIEACSGLVGFRGEDLEADYRQRIGEEQMLRLAEWGIEHKRLEAPRAAPGLHPARQIATGISEAAETAVEPVRTAELSENAREVFADIERHDAAERRERETRRAKIAEEFDRMQAEKILKGVQ